MAKPGVRLELGQLLCRGGLALGRELLLLLRGPQRGRFGGPPASAGGFEGC